MSVRILHGDVLAVLATLPSDNVQACVSSPPYFGLRDYQIPPSVWGGDPECDHQFVLEHVATEIGRGNWAQAVNGRGEAQGDPEVFREPIRARAERGFCAKCGGWKGCLGLEPTPTLYVEHMVEIFREVRRVLHPSGVLLLNLGDSYAGYHGNKKHEVPTSSTNGWTNGYNENQRASPIGVGGVKPKDLLGMPWMVAFALRADGWWLRSAIVWAKPNPMPESVTDRPTSSYEHVFLLAKSQSYFWDADAIAEPSITLDLRRPYGSQGAWDLDGRPVEQRPNGKPRTAGNKSHKYVAEYEASDTEEHRTKAGLMKIADVPWATRNARNVLTIASEPFPEAHFATMPPALAEWCVKAGTSERGCCPHCRAPWERMVERVDTGRKQKSCDGWDTGPGAHGTIHRQGRERGVGGAPVLASATTGWRPTCACPEHAPQACTVLDPFAGAGTTLLAADRLRRDAIGIELSADYVAMAERRLRADGPLFAEVSAGCHNDDARQVALPGVRTAERISRPAIAEDHRDEEASPDPAHQTSGLGLSLQASPSGVAGGPAVSTAGLPRC